MIFRRRHRHRRLPAELRPPLADGERVVAWATTAGGAAVVATNAGLFLPGRGPGGGLRRLGWHEIHKASWSGYELAVVPGGTVQQRAGYAVAADRPPETVPLPDPGDLPRVVRSRVTRSVSVSSHHPVPGGGVRVVARRVPGIDGLHWAVRYDDGTDPDGPGVADATDTLVAACRAAQEPAG